MQINIDSEIAIKDLENILKIPHFLRLPTKKFNNNHVVWIHPDFCWTLVSYLVNKNGIDFSDEINKLSKHLLEHLDELPREFFDQGLCEKAMSLENFEGEEYFIALEQTSKLTEHANWEKETI